MTVATRTIVPAESLRLRIYDDLRQRLQETEYLPGDRLVDTEIARKYGTSRMPAREALLALVAQGFLRQTSRGFQIPVLTAAEIRDIFEIRRLIEPPAAAKAVRHLLPNGLTALARARDRARQACAARDAKSMMLANMEFRTAWIGAVENARLRQMIEGFADHAQAVRIATLRDPAIRRIVLAGIEDQFGAFERQDATAARTCLRRFLRNAETLYFRLNSAGRSAR